MTNLLGSSLTPSGNRLADRWNRVIASGRSMVHALSHRLSARDRRTIQISVLVLLVGLIVVKGAPAWLNLVRNTQASAQRSVLQLELARSSYLEAPAISAIADSAAEAYFNLYPALLKGNTPAQATAALVGMVTEAASMAGMRIGTVQLTADSITSQNQIYRVRVRADATTDIHGLTAFLNIIESSGKPLISVKELTVSQSNPLAAPSNAENFRVSFTVEALASQGEHE